MNDLIELKLITRKDAECLHKLQIEAFMPLYEKYQDDATSPAKESLETITKKIVDDNSDFYFILFNGEKAGTVRVKWYKGPKVHKNVNWISPIFVIPKFQNKGIASNVIKQLFDIYPNTIEWWLSTIKQEEKNCHLWNGCKRVHMRSICQCLNLKRKSRQGKQLNWIARSGKYLRWLHSLEKRFL